MQQLDGFRRRSNCLLFALGLRLALGGRIRAVPSRAWVGPHFVWEDHRYVVDLVPVAPRPWLLPRVLPRVVFDGVVRVRAREALEQ